MYCDNFFFEKILIVAFFYIYKKQNLKLFVKFAQINNLNPKHIFFNNFIDCAIVLLANYNYITIYLSKGMRVSLEK